MSRKRRKGENKPAVATSWRKKKIREMLGWPVRARSKLMHTAE